MAIAGLPINFLLCYYPNKLFTWLGMYHKNLLVFSWSMHVRIDRSTALVIAVLPTRAKVSEGNIKI